MSMSLCRQRLILSASLVIAFAVASAQAMAETLRIGAPLALTGGLADEGRKQQVAYDMWLRRVNAAGGVQVGARKLKVELITYDYQTNEQRASQIAANTPGRPTMKAEAAAPAACHQSTSRLESVARLTSTAPDERPSDLATGAATR
jgi:hypothetical protein